MQRFWLVLMVLALAFAWGCDDEPVDGDGDADGDGDGDADGDGDGDADGDGDGDADGDGDGDTEPGGTCECDNDCVDVEGHDGICVFGICMTRASGACSEAGSQTECADGSRCWGLSGADGYICWPDCDTYDCDGSCDGDGSCVASEGMGCDPDCGSYCGGDTPVDGSIGGPCDDDSDCDGGECYITTGWVDGYCLAFGCSPAGEACGDGGVCIAGLTSDGTNVCLGSAADGCREGYQPSAADDGTQFCFPGCTIGGDDCPDGTVCQDVEVDSGPPVERCMPDFRCSDAMPWEGDCSSGEVCEDGECVPFECDASALEPGDDRADAEVVTETVEGLQICDGDDDWFSFTPSTEGVIYRVGQASYYGSGDLNIEILDPTGDVINIGDLVPSDYHEESGRGPMEFEGFGVVGATGAEQLFLHVFGHAGAVNNYDLIVDPSEWSDGPSCPDAGFSSEECTAISAAGFNPDDLLMFSVTHPADTYVGAGFTFISGFDGRSYMPSNNHYIRRDLLMALRYAMHVVSEEFPGTEPLGIGEVTMPDGTTPAGHPFWTHHYGGNIDFSYFIRDDAQSLGQLSYRQICNDASSLTDWSCVDTDGSHGQFGECITGCGDGHIVDIPRTARFLAAMAESGMIRVFGVDTSVDDDLEAEFRRLEGEGVAGAAIARTHMASADVDSSWVWHFNHIHMSFD